MAVSIDERDYDMPLSLELYNEVLGDRLPAADRPRFLRLVEAARGTRRWPGEVRLDACAG